MHVYLEAPADLYKSGDDNGWVHSLLYSAIKTFKRKSF